MKKFQAFPNKQFKSQKEYFDFINMHHIYGAEAYELKKKIDNVKLKKENTSCQFMK